MSDIVVSLRTEVAPLTNRRDTFVRSQTGQVWRLAVAGSGDFREGPVNALQVRLHPHTEGPA